MKKTQPKKQTPKPNSTPVDNKQPETAPAPAPASQPVTPAPVTAPPAASTDTPKDEKPKAPSISTVVRKLVINNPDKSVDEVSQLLIDSGWDAADVEKRKSTIATLRTDALAILKIAKECGWEKR